MLVLILIGFLGGLVTGISPCILPVVPVIFAAGASAGLDEGGVEDDDGESGPHDGCDGAGADTPTGGRRCPVRRRFGTGEAGPSTRRLARRSTDAPWRPDRGPAGGPARPRRPFAVVGGLVLSFAVFTLWVRGCSVCSVLPQDLLRWLD